MDQSWLIIRNLAMIALFPGTVVVYIPYRLLDPFAFPAMVTWSALQYFAVALVTIGGVILLGSVWSFARVGRGTLAPFDETRRLIVVGLYRYVRNPMYVGVTFMLLAESLFFRSTVLLAYAGACFVVANVMVIGYEEHRLRYKYGDDYRRYCEHVGRWIPGRPYPGAG